MKIERILSILILLLDKEIVSASVLANKFEVTKRTIYRDITTLEYAGFPIISYPGKNGGFGLLDTFKMNKFTFNNQEKMDILEAIHFKDELLSTEINKSVLEEKIRLIHDGVMEANYPSLACATLHRSSIENETKIKLKAVRDSLTQKKKLEIVYVSSYGDFTTRIICPIELKLENGSWYLEAFCEIRNDWRLFKITRIRKIEMLNISFEKIRPNIALFEEKVQQIKLVFPISALGKLYDFYTDNEIEIKDTTIQVTFLYEISRNIVPFLLMFGHQVKVVAPQYLQVKHAQEIARMQIIY